MLPCKWGSTDNLGEDGYQEEDGGEDEDEDADKD